MKYIKEEFNSIRKMLEVIERRPNNTVMRNEHSSDRDDYGFTHTHSYNEARGLLLNGWDGCLDEIKTALKAVQAGGTADRRKVTTGVVGYAPHVPNAILGVPNSMIMTEQKPKKQKVISILFDSTENAGTEANELAKAGIAVLGAVQSLEQQGVRVNLKVAFFTAHKREEAVFATLKLKDYREHLDLKKICFPIAHPSMFRRIGFKWLETCEGITEEAFAYGYGSHYRFSEHKQEYRENVLDRNEVFIDLDMIREAQFDVKELLKKIEEF